MGFQDRFTYHAPSTQKVTYHQWVRRSALTLAERIDGIAPDCREKSLAITALEECVMWANAAIARNPEVEP
jgi:hypothetical protein